MKPQKQQQKLKSPKSTPSKLIVPASEKQHADSISSLLTQPDKENEEKFIHVDKRKRKRSISRKVGFLDTWKEYEAKLAIQLEQMYIQRDRKCQTLIISFPDESIRYSKVRGYSKNIERVKFIGNVAQRYCYVKLKPDVNVKEEIAKISKIPFQKGFLRAKLRPPPPYEPPPLPLEVDPTTLYVGNLPVDTFIAELRKLFKNAVRIDMGYSLKSKWRRYALIKFRNALEAAKAFERSYDSHIRQTSLIVRFHRVKNWEVLKKAEILNELEEIRVKKEQIDAEYDKALQRAKSMVPAYFPFVKSSVNVKEELLSSNLTEEQRKNILQHRNEISKSLTDLFSEKLVPAYFPFVQPIIVKQEPQSPNSEENCTEDQRTIPLQDRNKFGEDQITVVSQDQNQFHQIASINNSYPSNQIQNQLLDKQETAPTLNDSKRSAPSKEKKKQHKKLKTKSNKEMKDTGILQDKANLTNVEKTIDNTTENFLKKSIFDVEDTLTELTDAKLPAEKLPKKRKSSLKVSNQGVDKKRLKSKEKHETLVQNIQTQNLTELLIFGPSPVKRNNNMGPITPAQQIFSPQSYEH